MATRKPKARAAGPKKPRAKKPKPGAQPAKANAPQPGKAKTPPPAKAKAPQPAKAKAQPQKARAEAARRTKMFAPGAAPKARPGGAPAKKPRVPAAPTSYVKVFLHDRGQDVEAAWCEPAGKDGARSLFRLANVPFAHPKPTYGDVIAARRDDDYGGNWAWNRAGAESDALAARLHEDAGRYTLIVEYTLADESDIDELCRALHHDHDVVSELAYGPRGKSPGRLFLAAPGALPPPAVMAALGTAGPGFQFTLVHPV